MKFSLTLLALSSALGAAQPQPRPHPREEAVFDYSRMALRGADFRGALLPGDSRQSDPKVYRTTFKASDLAFSDFSKARMEAVDFGKADITFANFAGARLGGSSFANVHASKPDYPRTWAVNFADADANHADFSRADLEGAKFYNAQLLGAQFRYAGLRGAYFNQANMRSATLVKADLYQAHLAETDLEGANLADAILTETDLHGSNLRGANLQGALLLDADLSGAHLEGADLSDARIFGTELKGATFDKFSKLPMSPLMAIAAGMIYVPHPNALPVTRVPLLATETVAGRPIEFNGTKFKCYNRECVEIDPAVLAAEKPGAVGSAR